MDGVERFCGKQVGESDLELIRDVVGRFQALTRTELAYTVCDQAPDAGLGLRGELLGWQRASGRSKARECREYLERLERAGLIELPALRRRRPRGSPTSIPSTAAGEFREGIGGEAGELAALELVVVEEEADRRLWREWMFGPTPVS